MLSLISPNDNGNFTWTSTCDRPKVHDSCDISWQACVALRGSVRENRSQGCGVIRWSRPHLLRTRSELVWIQSGKTQKRWWKSCATYPRSTPSPCDACSQDRWPKRKPSTACATWACLGTRMWRFMSHDCSCDRSASRWSAKQDKRSSTAMV